jgi:hypothetical protein
MSNEHTESNQQQAEDHPRRRRNRKRRERTLRWFHDTNVGVDDLKANVVAKFFITTAQDETPSIRLVLMNRDTVIRPDGSVAMKSDYAGDIERNSIPLEILDLEALWNAMVSMKSRQKHMADEFHGRPHKEEPSLPKRSQQPARPLVHRMAFPPKVVAKVAPKESPDAAAHEPAPDAGMKPAAAVVEPKNLADALLGW